MQTKTLIVNADGWRGREKNPHEKLFSGGAYNSGESSEYHDFEATNKDYPLTEWCKPGSEVVCERYYNPSKTHALWMPIKEHHFPDATKMIENETVEQAAERLLLRAGWDDYKLNGKSFRQIAIDAITVALGQQSQSLISPNNTQIRKCVAQILVDEFAKDLPSALWEMYSKEPTSEDIEWAKSKVSEYKNAQQNGRQTDEKALSYCKHMGYSKTGSQYSAFITGHNSGFSSANQRVIELLEVERDAYAKLADEENDLLLKNIANGVAIALTDILLNKINQHFKPTKK